MNPKLSRKVKLTFSKAVYAQFPKVILALSLVIILAFLSVAQAASWNTPLNLTNSPEHEADPYISGNGNSGYSAGHRLFEEEINRGIVQ
jgi:hypothetical protein